MLTKRVSILVISSARRSLLRAVQSALLQRMPAVFEIKLHVVLDQVKRKHLPTLQAELSRYGVDVTLSPVPKGGIAQSGGPGTANSGHAQRGSAIGRLGLHRVLG